MAEASFYWHDYETWGANPRVDRPAQFAGIRTDADLNIVGEPLMLYARPTADFLPNPEAVLITGITPQQALQQGVCEADFFKRIHQEFQRARSCIVGYNNIRFDDEVTRFGFYRNFIDSYAYSWQNGNSRWDLLDLMRLTHALRPEGIQWPMREDGTASFKLTDLTEANNIEQEGAHDALVDVRATIAIAKLVKQQQPRLFDYYFQLRLKNRVAELLNPLKPEILLHVSGMFPVQQGCLAPVYPLMAHPVNANEIICYNLRFDPHALLSLNAEEIQQKLYTKTLDLEVGEQRLPLKGIHLNKSPALAPVSTLNAEQARKWQIDWDDVQHNLELLLSDSTLLDRLKKAYSIDREFDKPDADSALYDGFIGKDDRLLCNQVLASSPERLAEWSDNSFQDPRLNQLLFRYRARNYPDSLSPEEVDEWQQFCRDRVLQGESGAGLSAEQFQQQLLTLAQTEQGQREQQLLDHLSNWAQKLFE